MRIFPEHPLIPQRLILRRLIAMRQIVPVALLSALMAVPLAFAQRTGSRSGGFAPSHIGGPGRSFSGPVGHSFGGSFNPGRIAAFPTHSFGAAPRMTFTPSTRAFAPASAWRGHDRDRGGRDRSGRYRSPYRGYGYGYAGYPYAYASSWELLPSDLGYSDFTGGNDEDTGADTAQQPAAPESLPPNDGYRPEYNQLAGEPSYDDYAPPPVPYPRRSSPAAALSPEPQLTLIFKDGHEEPIQNYVLTSDTLIVMDQPATGRQQRIPLADVNLSATEQAAQQAGLDFTPPG